MAAVKAPAPEGERFTAQIPTAVPPQEHVSPVNLNCCGNCPGWNRTHVQAPFGQCLPAIRWLGAPLYTPDLAGCSLPPEAKAKGSRR